LNAMITETRGYLQLLICNCYLRACGFIEVQTCDQLRKALTGDTQFPCGGRALVRVPGERLGHDPAVAL